ncbi:methyltransferase family protein [Taklimakanibacter lacteus]|uniref:methyltransferase family protein n=1 Tax=Taklimakanibacter lacteus TaxID=2268456 RepID=UPI000E6737DB
MPDTSKPQDPPLPPSAQLVQMASANWVSCIVHAAAKFDLADKLADGPKTAAEIAGALKLHAPSLHRMMRSLAGLGILTESDGRRFGLTPLG